MYHVHVVCSLRPPSNQGPQDMASVGICREPQLLGSHGYDCITAFLIDFRTPKTMYKMEFGYRITFLSLTVIFVN